jgi:hypothetical protein
LFPAMQKPYKLIHIPDMLKPFPLPIPVITN